MCASIYLLIRSDLTLNLIALGLMLGCSVCSEAGLFSTIGFIQYLPSEATLHAFGLTGVVASILMQRFANPERPNCFLLLFLQIGIGMLIAGVCETVRCWGVDDRQVKIDYVLGGTMPKITRCYTFEKGAIS